MNDKQKLEYLVVTLHLIYKILEQPASNRRFMQIAEPARRVRNEITSVLKTIEAD